MSVSVIMLAGGTGRRLGGQVKPDLVVSGRSLLQWSWAALTRLPQVQQTIIVAPPEVCIPHGAIRTLENPPGGGPLAGIAAGLHLATQELVLCVTCDAPIAPLLLPQLTAALRSAPQAQAAVSVRSGRANHVAALYRTEALRAVVDSGPVRNVPVRSRLAELQTVFVDDPQGWGNDVDTWADLPDIEDLVRRHLMDPV